MDPRENRQHWKGGLAAGGKTKTLFIANAPRAARVARAEPKTLRYRILHAAARLVHGGRRRCLKIAATWPWAEAAVTAWQHVQAIPHPT